MIDINLKPNQKKSCISHIFFIFVTMIASLISIYLYNKFLDQKILNYKNLISPKKIQMQLISNLTDEKKKLQNQIIQINDQIKESKQINTANINRYQSIMLIEYIQNLLPANLWLENIKYNNKNKTIEIMGKGYDNYLISNFINDIYKSKNIYFKHGSNSYISFKDISIKEIVSKKDEFLNMEVQYFHAIIEYEINL